MLVSTSLLASPRVLLTLLLLPSLRALSCTDGGTVRMVPTGRPPMTSGSLTATSTRESALLALASPSMLWLSPRVMTMSGIAAPSSLSLTTALSTAATGNRMFTSERRLKRCPTPLSFVMTLRPGTVMAGAGTSLKGRMLSHPPMMMHKQIQHSICNIINNYNHELNLIPKYADTKTIFLDNKNTFDNIALLSADYGLAHSILTKTVLIIQ